MRTEEERISALHARMNARRRKREKRITAGLYGVCAVLTLCLTGMIFGGSGTGIGGTAGLYTGTMLRFGDAGAYVLTAVLAFMAGVGVTVLLIRQNGGKGDVPGKRGQDPAPTAPEVPDEKTSAAPEDPGKPRSLHENTGLSQHSGGESNE